MPQPQSVVPPLKEFDIQVQHRDKHGNLVKENHYAYHIIDGTQYFERPIGSGNLFEPSGVACGRLIDRRRLEVDASAEHVEMKVAPTGAELMAVELDLAKDESQALRKELEELRKEKALRERIKELEAKVVSPAAPQPAAVKVAPSGKYAAHIKEE